MGCTVSRLRFKGELQRLDCREELAVRDQADAIEEVVPRRFWLKYRGFSGPLAGRGGKCGGRTGRQTLSATMMCSIILFSAVFFAMFRDRTGRSSPAGM